MSIQVGQFPPWSVDEDDIHVIGTHGREFAIKCHVTVGMGSEVVALLRDANGNWQFSAYIDDYVDSHYAGDVNVYLQDIFVPKLQTWLSTTFGAVPANAQSVPVVVVGTAIEHVHAGLKLLKITSNPDGTFTVNL